MAATNSYIRTIQTSRGLVDVIDLPPVALRKDRGLDMRFTRNRSIVEFSKALERRPAMCPSYTHWISSVDD